VTGKASVTVPFSDFSGHALVGTQQEGREISGLNDPRFRFTVNFLGSPALSVKEFQSYQQDLIVGASLEVSPPLGQYDADKLVNIGNHRWFIAPELGLSKAWGPWTLELRSGVIFFTDNDEYFGGRTFAEAPLFNEQAHLTYSLGKGFWVALTATYDLGGHTTVEGVDRNDPEQNLRPAVTLAVPLNARQSLKFFAGTHAYTKNANAYRIIGLAWQYRWGEGL
jgi:hypothetical protein